MTSSALKKKTGLKRRPKKTDAKAVDAFTEQANYSSSKKEEEITPVVVPSSQPVKTVTKIKPDSDKTTRFNVMFSIECIAKIKLLREQGVNMQPRIRSLIYPVVDELFKSMGFSDEELQAAINSFKDC